MNYVLIQSIMQNMFDFKLQNVINVITNVVLAVTERYRCDHKRNVCVYPLFYLKYLIYFKVIRHA